MNRLSVTRAMNCLQWFLMTNKKMQLLVKTCFNLVIFMQKLTVARRTCKNAKLEVLMNCWSKLLGQLNMQNTVSRSKQMSQIIVGITDIPRKVQRGALK